MVPILFRLFDSPKGVVFRKDCVCQTLRCSFQERLCLPYPETISGVQTQAISRLILSDEQAETSRQRGPAKRESGSMVTAIIDFASFGKVSYG